MREFLTDKNFIETKILLVAKFILIVSLLVFFLPLIILPFFNHPSTDDFFCGYQLNSAGFIPYQFFIYDNWGGRFAATFAGSLFAYHNFLYTHYYLHSLLLLALNFISIFFLVSTLHKFILKGSNTLSKKLLISVIFLALEICSLPQASTFIFWFSSAITYQFPIILIQFEISLFLLYVNSNNKLLRNIGFIVLPLLIFITIGFNEFFIVVQLLLFASAYYFRTHEKCSTIFVIFIALAFVAGSALLIFSPGNRVRLNDVVPKNFYVGVVSVAYHSFETLWSTLRTPFVWFAVFAIFVYADERKAQWQNNIHVKNLFHKKWIPAATLFVFLVIAVSLPVAALKGGLIPDRYINAVSYCIVLLLMVCFFFAGITGSKKIFAFSILRRKILFNLLFSAGLLFNNYIIDAYKSVIIAPVYNNILSERESALKTASQQNKVAVVQDYNTALSGLLQTKYKTSTVTFQQLIQQKPPLLFFEDDLANYHSIDILKKYYKLDSVIVKK